MSQAVTGMPKQRLQVTLRKDLIEWMDIEVEKGIFASYSHAIERALIKLKEIDEKKEMKE
jgi:Arc/MetJ-type ribon-helix-helix transcriptional regulator